MSAPALETQQEEILEFLAAWDRGELEEPEPEDPDCECVQVDVDYFDARWCRAHGRSGAR